VTIIPRYAHEKIGFTNDGIITAVEDSIVVDGGVRGSSNFGTTMDIMWNPFYTTKCKNTKSFALPVNTNTSRMYVSGQHWPYNWDVLTIAEQMVADKLDMDPVDVAMKNIHGPKSQNDESIPESFRLCVEKGKKAINWQWHKSGTKKLKDGRMHGLSFRYQMCPRHAEMTYSCTVILKNDGKVYIPTKGPWFGNYNTDAVAMVVAEEMGAKYEDVILEFNSKSIFTPMGGGSDGTTASSWVAKEAAFKCRKQFLKSAASHPKFKELKAKWKDLEASESKVFLKLDPKISFPFSEIASKTEIIESYSGRPPVATWNTGRGKILETMNATFCEVAVDADTGKVEVLQYVIAADPGKIIRPTSIIGQLNQVMMFTSGSNLSEDVIFDKKTGVKLNSNMIDYKKPTILDVAPVEPVLFETRAGNACYGGAGISHSMASTHLVVCAAANAIGKWIDPPMTPDRVLKALGKA
jgi:CO/xanthine dehydrogenase Mo-binding subunit